MLHVFGPAGGFVTVILLYPGQRYSSVTVFEVTDVEQDLVHIIMYCNSAE